MGTSLFDGHNLPPPPPCHDWNRVNKYICHNRAVGRSDNPGVPVLFGGHNRPPLVEIGLTDLPKSGGAMALPAPPGTTGLQFYFTFWLRTYRLGSYISK